jgi:Fic family protein
MNREKMLENLSMFWEGGFDFRLPSAGSPKNALHIFNQNIVKIVYHFMSTLERNPTSLPQTATILHGQSVSGLTLDEVMQVKRYGDGAKSLMTMIADGTFALDAETACALHNHVGKDEALTWGKFRNSLVMILNVDEYTPPDSKLLHGIAAKGFSFLAAEVASPQERAIAAFLFMARTQFFHDANKRAASLMMNGVLMSEGLYPVTILNHNSEEFHTKLTDFYNTGNASQLMQFFEKSVKSLYQAQE